MNRVRPARTRKSAALLYLPQLSFNLAWPHPTEKVEATLEQLAWVEWWNALYPKHPTRPAATLEEFRDAIAQSS